MELSGGVSSVRATKNNCFNENKLFNRDAHADKFIKEPFSIIDCKSRDTKNRGKLSTKKKSLSI